jgi:hypothetical protein
MCSRRRDGVVKTEGAPEGAGGRPMGDPQAQVERALMDEYIRLHCYDPETVRLRPAAEVMALLEAASEYAARRLAEFESKAPDVHAIRTKD